MVDPVDSLKAVMHAYYGFKKDLRTAIEENRGKLLEFSQCELCESNSVFMISRTTTDH